MHSSRSAVAHIPWRRRRALRLPDPLAPLDGCVDAVACCLSGREWWTPSVWLRVLVVGRRRRTIKALNPTRCNLCGFTGAREHFDRDHRIPVWLGGRHVAHNRQTLCARCHRRKTKLERRIIFGIGHARGCACHPCRLFEAWLSYADPEGTRGRRVEGTVA